MRLLNVETYQLEQFLEDARPPYAILSHTWGDNETTYQDVEAGRKRGEGWNEIEACCRQAVQHGYKYVWVDTCCIDKSSSAELSEAINSMYRWYKDSEICYVYMSDVPQGEIHSNPGSAFRSSRWFSRVLDYLLREILERPGDDAFLARVLSSSTAISLEIVRTGRFDKVPIAQRLSWASHRTTTRIEDMAYSLLGVLGFNMPLLYGEGKAAFERLQEVLRTKMDQSCLCWGLNIGWDEMTHERPHLAESPALFRECGKLGYPFFVQQYVLGRIMFQSVRNQGVQIEVPVIKIDKKRRISLALLPYGSENNNDCIAIPLENIWEDSYFRRLEGSAPFVVPSKSFKKTAIKKICLLSREHVNFYGSIDRVGPTISWLPSKWTCLGVSVHFGKLLSAGYRMAGYYPPPHVKRGDEKSFSYSSGIDVFFLEFTNGSSRIGVSLCGVLQSKSRLKMRLFRIHSGATLAVAFSVRRLQNRVWSRRTFFDEHVLLDECCSRSICEDPTHLHLLHNIKYNLLTYNWRKRTEICLDGIHGDSTTIEQDPSEKQSASNRDT